MSQASFESRRGIWKRWWFITPMVLVLIGGIIWAGFVFVGKVERRQTRKLVELAEGYLKEGKITQARMGVETALRLNPANAEALRMQANFHFAEGEQGEAFLAMSRLADSGQLSFSELLTYVTLAARQGYTTLSDQWLDSVARRLNPVSQHLLRAQANDAMNNTEEAEKEMRAAWTLDPMGEPSLVLARFLLTRRRTPETEQEILALLKKTSISNESLGVEALVIGLSSQVVPISERDWWISALRNHPLANESGLLVADAAEMSLRPTMKTEVVGRMAERLSGRSLAERVQGMVLAMQAGESKTAAGLLNPEEAAASAEALPIWLDALALQNRWSEILEVLSRSQLALPEYLKRLYTGRALKETGKPVMSREAFEAALEVTQSKMGEYIMVLAYLAFLEENELLERALRQGLEDPKNRDVVLRAVVVAVSVWRDAARTQRIYKIAAAMPQSEGDLALQNDLDYHSILLGQPVDLRTLAERSHANPRDFALRVTHALALLKAENAKQAFAELDQCEPGIYVETLPPPQMAVVAAATALNGRMSEAQALARLIPPGSLLKQESEFLMACLESGKSAGESDRKLEKQTTPAR